MSTSGARRLSALPAAVLVTVLAVLATALQTAGAGGAVAGVDIVQSVTGVTGRPTALTLAAYPPVVARGGGATLSGRLTDPSTGAGVAGATVTLEALGTDGGWVAAGSGATDPAGSVSVSEVPASTTTFRLHFGSPGTAEESLSEPVTVSVVPLTAALSSTATRVGTPVTVSGVLAGGGGRSLRLEGRAGDGWQVLARTTSGEGGAYSFRTAPASPGYTRLRVARGPVTAPTVSAGLPRLDAFRLHTYSVRSRGAVRADVEVFRAEVARTYADRRGWLGAHHRFRPAAPGRPGDFTVVLSQPRFLPAFSGTCSTSFSCRVGRNVIINEARWRFGSRHFPGTLEEYRDMVVNHETGHWLGLGHAGCSAPGRRAPVMQQQSKGMLGCRVNPWPLPAEVRAAS